MARIYLIETEKNIARERAVGKAYDGQFVAFITSNIKRDGVFFNGDVIDVINLQLQKEIKDTHTLVCMEGGFFKIGGRYFIGDICGIKEKGKTRYGSGYFFEISKSMYLCAKNNVSIRSVIKDITGKNYSVVSYLTDNLFQRSASMQLAVNNAKVAENGKLPTKLKLVKRNDSLKFNLLDEACEELLKERKLN